MGTLFAFLLASTIPTPIAAASLDADGQSPSDARQKHLAAAVCESDPALCRCPDASTSTLTVVRTVAGQFVDPEADELVAHLDHCEGVATAVFRHSSETEAGASESWRLVTLHRDVDTRTCRRFDFDPGTDRLICHRALEEQTWRVGFFHALAFSDGGLERRQLTSYESNARGCPSDVLRTEHPLGWRIWHRPDDPRSALLTIFFQHRNGRVPESFADACEAMRRGEPVFGPRRRVTEYFEWTDGRFAFTGATRMRRGDDAASWTSAERLEAPICRRRDALDRIDARRDAFRRCYAESIDGDHPSAGVLTLEWTVGSDGSVESIEVREDELDDDALSRCVRRVVAQMEFPPPRGGDSCSFVYPFEFGEGK